MTGAIARRIASISLGRNGSRCAFSHTRRGKHHGAFPPPFRIVGAPLAAVEGSGAGDGPPDGEGAVGAARACRMRRRIASGRPGMSD